jgi:Family of unknown function (DUF5994)
VDDQVHIVLDDPNRSLVGRGRSTDMRSGPHLRVIIPPAAMATEPPRQTLRLKLKPKAPTTGYVDGAWWPRSRDLSAELPALLAVLAVRLGGVQRVSYNLTAWDVAPHRITVDGRSVRLGGFHSQHADTVDVIGHNEPRITLLVIPPEAMGTVAHQVLLRAGRRGNIDTIGELLTPTATTEPVPATSDLPDTAEERWEGDGGRLNESLTTTRIPRQRR